MMGRPDAVVFNLTRGVSILVNRVGVVTLMDGDELADISGTGLGCILADMYEWIHPVEQPQLKGQRDLPETFRPIRFDLAILDLLGARDDLR